MTCGRPKAGEPAIRRDARTAASCSRSVPESGKSNYMPQTEDILSTLRMVKQENLDVRTVTMGINLVRLR